MVEMVIVVAMLLIMVGISAYFAFRPLQMNEKRRMSALKKEELVALIREKCKEMRVCQNGGEGVSCARFYSDMLKVKRRITRLVKDNLPLSNAEKWYYENFYIVYRFIFSGCSDLSKLPHCENEPRILKLARLIVDNSLGELDENRIKYVIENVKDVFKFTFGEIRDFNVALGIALVEQIYILSQRLNYVLDCKEQARKGRLSKNYINKDVYLYQLIQNNGSNETLSESLRKAGVDKNKVINGYNFVMMRNTKMAETLFGALGKVERLFPIASAISLSGAYNVIGEKIDIKNVSIDTLCDYFSIIEKISRRRNVSETYTAEKLLELSSLNDCDISVILFDHSFSLSRFVSDNKRRIFKRRKNFGATIYGLSIFAVSLCLSVISGVILRSVVFGIFSFIPFFFFVENLTDYLLSHLRVGVNTPSMNFEKVPYDQSALIVVSEYVSGIEQLKKSVFHAETLLSGNFDPNVSVGILIDTPSDTVPVTDLDREIIDYLSKKDFPKNLYFYVRKKSYLKKKFVAKERKRGALMALVKYLVTKESFEFLFVSDNGGISPEYLITLDADNTVLPGEAIRLVNMMSHPYNSRYDILTLQGRTNLYSLKNLFTLRYADEGGFDEYPNFSGFYYKLFKSDVYCGKGIIRTDRLYNELEEIFPREKILSHDIIEGSILKTGSGGTCFEDAPENFISDRERKKRWMRGDIQLLPFVFGVWKNEEKKKHKRKISSLGRFIMLKNVFHTLKDACLLVLFLLGICTNSILFLCATGLFVLPYVVNQIKILRRWICGDKITSILTKSVKNLMRMAEDFCLMGYYAIDNLCVICTTLFRMCSKRNLLEWKTFYSSQASRNFSSYIRLIAVPTLALTVISAIILSLSINVLPCVIYIFSMFLAFDILYILSKIDLKNKDISENEKEKLKELAAKTYKYFCFMRNSNGLIADNFQVKPYKGQSKYTSPTDIAFSILAEVCAFCLEMISFEECVFNVKNIIISLSSLKKWYGNYYNWYKIADEEPANKFVSSVDNGNLAAVLLLTQRFFKERGESVVSSELELLLVGMRLDKLFDKNRKLFYIGFDGKNYCGHYDLLASESRILSVVYVALYHDYSHFLTLKKDFSGIGNNVLLSWSGTMFEMLMPEIFFAPPYSSALYYSEKYTVKKQRKEKIKGVWGISESGYYAFDDDMLYQYSAFGIKSLALNAISDSTVITPYSSVLGLRFYPRSVVRNIEELKKEGCSFEYGMFEAIDFARGKQIVCSAMSHHQGMILASVTNFLTDNILQKTMKNAPNVASCMEYFNEKRPERRYCTKTNKKREKYAYSDIIYSKNINKIEQYYHSAVLSDAQYSIICNSLGGGFSRIDNILINKNTGVYEENNGMFFFASPDGKEWKSPTYLPFADEKTEYGFSYSTKEIIYRSDKGLTENVTLLPMLNCEVRKFGAEEKYKFVAFYYDVCADASDAYDSHPAFRDLFVSVKQISEDTIVVEKRFPGKRDRVLFIGVKVIGLDKVRWECNKANFIGRGNGLRKARYLFESDNNSDYPSLGDVLYPCVGFKGEFLNAKNECIVVLAVGSDENSIKQNLSEFSEDVYNCALQSEQRISFGEKFNDLSGDVIYALSDKSTMKNISESGKIGKYKNFTNGKKVITFDFDENNSEKINGLVEIYNDFRIIGFPIKIAIYTQKELSDNLKKYIVEIFEENRIKDYEFVFGICDEKYWAFTELDSELNFKKKQFSFSRIFSADAHEEDTAVERILPNSVFATGDGFFTENGDYIVSNRNDAPYTDVIGDVHGGIIATADGGGFYYFGNSRENKCVRFDNDPVGKSAGERFFVKTVTGYNDIFKNAENCLVTVGKGEISCNVYSEAFDSIVSHYTVLEGKVKVSEVRISKKNKSFLEFIYAFYPAASWRYNPCDVVFTQNGDVIRVKNIVTEQEFYVRIIGINKSDLTNISDNEPLPFFEYYLEKDEERFFIVSSTDIALIYSLNEDNLKIYKQTSGEYFSSLSDIDIVTKEKSFDYLVGFLPYQIVSSRLNAKAGFYQVGGATGFRDQLQDSLAFFTRPEVIKQRIEAACLHQYEEGDVMHWWHEPKLGLRTKITDDKLFLPYAVCQYIKYSGDVGFLDEEYPYLRSAPLSPFERDRYENPPYTEYKERVFSHCLRAIRSSLKYGQHRLLVMGNGDWNDGMDKICEKGRGESVFNSMFAYTVLDEFSELCPVDLQAEMRSVARELKDAVNAFAFEEDRYKRLFSDDGRWLGSSRSDVLKIDLLTQAFAVISGVADPEKATKCMESAKMLIDKNSGIIRLLSPPLNREKYLGYISDYPEGVRENGGQYTHAAMWYLIALAEVGKQDEAFELFQMINPVEKCRNEENNTKYACEPYVLCGDVYSNEYNYGHGGWSWYTGSAAWAYKLVTEYFLGLKRRGKRLFIEPKLPKKLVGSVVVYRYENSEYAIEYRVGLLPKIIVDGEERDSIELTKNVRKSVVAEIEF